MVRAYHVVGPAMVYVKTSIGGLRTRLTELGLASDMIQMNFRYFHKEIKTDDYGPDMPAEILTGGADCLITMDLVHFDFDVLELCMRSAVGTGLIGGAGTMGAVGRPLGTGELNFFGTARWNRFTLLNIVPSRLGATPWRFPNVYIMGQPLTIPLGTEKSIIRVTWRAVPFTTPTAGTTRGEVTSLGAVLYDNTIEPVANTT